MLTRLFGMFGRKPTEGEGALTAIRHDWAAFLIQPTDQDVYRALESWSWIGLPKTKPILVSAFGDMFFMSASGIVMLDTLDGTVSSVAKDTVELGHRLSQAEHRDHLLSDVWVQAASRRGLKLEPGECFDWAVAPALGGKIGTDNLTKLSFVVKVNLSGQLHRQVKALPPGTKINRVTISD